MIADALTLVWEWRSQRPAGILDSLLAVIRAHGVTETGYRYRGRTVAISSAISAVRRSSIPAFSLDREDRKLHFASLADKFDQVIIGSPRPDAVSCDEWVAALLAGPSRFVMGWLADQEYQYWQNVAEPWIYAADGREHGHLPKRPSGLPPPLDGEVIDTSQNPGRVLRVEGYCEAVGAIMWLGEPFWALTGASREGVEKASWLQARQVEGGVIRIQALDGRFPSAEGASGALQRDLRALLFPRARASKPSR